MGDLIERQAAIDVICDDKIDGKSMELMELLGNGLQAETLNMTCDRHVKMLMQLPSAQLGEDALEDAYAHGFTDAESRYRDMTEIVHCRECNYQRKGENDFDAWNLCGYRSWQYIPIDDNHYCGWGERRKDG